MAALRRFSSRADSKVLKELRELAAREGRQFQAVLGEALREYLSRKANEAPRKNVLEAFHDSVEERHQSYRSLAK